ncbi:MAG: DUF1631 family protein [Pseudomonadota bacterium]
MDRNALLQATRTKFLEAFLLAADVGLATKRPPGSEGAGIGASATAQRATLEASHLLQDRQADLRNFLRQRMEQLLERSLQTTYSTFRPTFSKEFTSNKLTLIDFTQLENQLLIDEITTRFRNAAEHPLRDLNIRIALLFEQKTIQERENPFRPWLFTQCIVSAIEALGTRPEVTSLLLQQIAGRIESDIATIYNAVNGFLIEHGIAAQLQLVRAESSHSTPLPASMPTPLYNVEPHTASQFERALSPTLMQAVLAFRASALKTTSASTDAAADAVTNVGANVDANALHNHVRANLEKLSDATSDRADHATIDAVATLVDFILTDEFTELQVRTTLARLQPDILETALKEPIFFTQPSHPLRRLINLLGSVALVVPNASATNTTNGNSQVLVDIQKIISDGVLDDESLNNKLPGDANNERKALPLRTMLIDLQASIAKNFSDSAIQQAHAARVLEQAQRQLAQYVSLCAQLEAALSGLIIDPFLRDFLTQSWTLVIDAAQRQNCAATPVAISLRKLVPDLLWSIVPHGDAESRAQLLTFLPTLTRAIREGLATIDWTVERQQPTLDWLMRVHRNCLQKRSQTTQTPSLAAVQAHFQGFVDGGVEGNTTGTAKPNMPTSVTPPYSTVHAHYLDRAIRRIDLSLRRENAVGMEAAQRLLYVERSPLFDRAMEAIPHFTKAPTYLK